MNREAVTAVNRVLLKAAKNVIRTLLVLAGCVLVFSPTYAAEQRQADDAVESVITLIHQYERSISDADSKLAGAVWLQTGDVSFIHPLGHEHGFEEIRRDIYERLMGQTFSERQLTASDISVHAYKDAAWAEFNWLFVGKLRSNGSAVKTTGRETQVYCKTAAGWRLVHVHYSALLPPPNSAESAVKASNLTY